jgi:hypothetical protein
MRDDLIVAFAVLGMLMFGLFLLLLVLLTVVLIIEQIKKSIESSSKSKRVVKSRMWREVNEILANQDQEGQLL